MGAHVQSGGSNDSGEQNQGSNGVNDIDLEVYAESDYKKIKRTNGHHVNTCLKMNVNQKEHNQRTYQSSQKEKIQFWKAVNRNAFLK